MSQDESIEIGNADGEDDMASSSLGNRDVEGAERKRAWSASNSPDVLVLGMPSSGKTVFLSVLGRNFTLVADDSDARPLGFRMRAIGRSTLETVSRNYARILGGEWPASTVAGSVTPLTWDVFTGARKVFTLSSMDVSGESFVKAFCESGRDAIRQQEQESDGLLDMTNSESGTDEAVELLRELAVSAKVICFFVNIAAARRGHLRSERTAGQLDFEAVRNYEEGIANICALLDDLPSLRAKTIVVLTQAHRHQSEIEKAGGPAAFLGRIAPNLRQTVAEFNIPVIAVSAINERDSEDGFDDEEDENAVPDTIESDGLFGFLLVVAGMIPDARLADIKDRYLRYLSDKSRYLQLPCRTILERLPLVKAYSSSGIAFEKGCLEYLADDSNVNAVEGEPLPRSAIDLYRRCTASDKDVAFAASSWKRRLTIDRAWNHVLRRIVLDEAKALADDEAGSAAVHTPSAHDIAQAVRDEVSAVDGCGNLTPAALYGFERDELDPARDAADEDAWVMKCLEEFRHRIVGELDGYMKLFVGAKKIVAEIEPGQNRDYNIQRDAAVSAITRCRKISAAFRDDWFVAESGGMPQLDLLDKEVESLAASMAKLDLAHDRWLDEADAERKRKAAAKERAQRIEEERIAARRKLMLTSGFCVVALTLVAALLVGRHGLVSGNERHIDDARDLYIKGNYISAEVELDKVQDYPRYFIWRRSSQTFVEFLDMVRKASGEEKQAEIGKIKKELDSARDKAIKAEADTYAQSYLEIAEKKLAESGTYSGEAKDFEGHCKKLRAINRMYEDAEKMAAEEKALAIREAEWKCKKAHDDAVNGGAMYFASSDVADAEAEQKTALGSYLKGKMSAKSYIETLGGLAHDYKEIKESAEKRKNDAVALAGKKCDEAYAEALNGGAGVFASADLDRAGADRREADVAYRNNAIDFNAYIDKLKAVEELCNSVKRRAANAKDVYNATIACDAARRKAEDEFADKFAADKFADANSRRELAKQGYENGALSPGEYLNKLREFEVAYREIAKIAKNNHPKVTIYAKRYDSNDYEMGVPITRGVGGDYKTPCVDVDLKKLAIGDAITFKAEGPIASEHGAVYTGEVTYKVQAGKHSVVIPLVPKYTLDNINYCPNCARRLPSKHIVKCPYCYENFSQYLK